MHNFIRIICDILPQSTGTRVTLNSQNTKMPLRCGSHPPLWEQTNWWCQDRQQDGGFLKKQSSTSWFSNPSPGWLNSRTNYPHLRDTCIQAMLYHSCQRTQGIYPVPGITWPGKNVFTHYPLVATQNVHVNTFETKWMELEAAVLS